MAVFIIDITALDRRLTEANAGIDTSTNKKNNVTIGIQKHGARDHVSGNCG